MRVTLRWALVRALVIASPSCVVCFVAANASAQDTQPTTPTPPPKRGGAGWGLPQRSSSDTAETNGVPAASTKSTSLKVTVEENAPAAPPSTSPPPREGTPNDGSVSAGERMTPDKTTDSDRSRDKLAESHFLHGFRLGYSFVANYDKPLESLDGRSFKDKAGVKSPHNFLIGYEMLVRMMGHSWLNVILLANGIIGGLEQSKVLPSGNALIGFEINNSFQVGVGAHLTPLKGQEAHVAVAAGWTPRVGGFYVPVHAFFIPDVDGNHRTGMLTGVTW